MHDDNIHIRTYNAWKSKHIIVIDAYTMYTYMHLYAYTHFAVAINMQATHPSKFTSVSSVINFSYMSEQQTGTKALYTYSVTALTY